MQELQQKVKYFGLHHQKSARRRKLRAAKEFHFLGVAYHLLEKIKYLSNPALKPTRILRAAYLVR